MSTPEARTKRARKAARVRWAWGSDGRALRAEMYFRRIMRALWTGDPRWLTREHRAAIGRQLNGVPLPWDRETARGDPPGV